MSIDFELIYRNQRLDEEAAEKNFQEIVSKHPWVADLSSLTDPIINANASSRSKMQSLVRLADRINDAVSTNVACQGNGCSKCCYQAVTVSGIEATWIHEKTGRPIKTGVSRSIDGLQEMRSQFVGKPCPFLKEGACSIYEVRPIACRLSMSIAHSPYFCDTQIPAELSAVPALNMHEFWLAYAKVSLKTDLGDIRDFFGNA